MNAKSSKQGLSSSRANQSYEMHLRRNAGKSNELWNVFEKKLTDFSTAFRTLFVAIFVGYLVLVVAENDVGHYTSVVAENDGSFSGRAVVICFALFVFLDLFQNVYSTQKAAADFDVSSGNKLRLFAKIESTRSRFRIFTTLLFWLKLLPVGGAFAVILTDIWEIL